VTPKFKAANFYGVDGAKLESPGCPEARRERLEELSFPDMLRLI